MTLQSDVAELFGLASTFPRPAWVVLDAARDHRFTGELVFDGGTPVRACFDRGQIYLAETTNDPSLGARLVDAGALNPAQLEHGAIRVGDAEDLSCLFDRAPSVDRQFVLVVTEMMNEACIAQLAGEQVAGVECTPYRFHPSGIHRWHRGATETELRAGDPLPAPGPLDVPVETSPPDSLFAAASNNTDTLIRWEQPSWLDDATNELHGRSRTPPEPAWIDSDWADRLATDGLPNPGDDPLASPEPLPALRPIPTDRFEVIWPSGEIDDGFGDLDSVAGLDERDRVGPTARVSKLQSVPIPHDATDIGAERRDPDPAPPRRHPTREDSPAPQTATVVRDTVEDATGPESTTSIWSARVAGSTRSVFDDVTDPQAAAVSLPPAETSSRRAAATTAVEPEAPRTSALRRLIGGLRRR